MRTKYTSTAADQNSAKNLFAFSAGLTGSKLLKVAETRSNQQISNSVSAAAAAAKPAVTNGPVLTGAAVASRIRGALVIRAAETGKTLREVQTDFAAIRKSNGIKVHVPGFARTSDKGKSIVKSIMPTTGKQGGASGSDSELSELETDDEQ
jgi:hypothetical protein